MGTQTLQPPLEDASVQVRPLHEAAEFVQVERLYRRVFCLRDGESAINTRLMIAFDHNSGRVIGAFRAGTLLGFAYSFLARDAASDRLYHYSQTAAVDPLAQGLGIGRALKYAQREAVMNDGVTLMRWAYDPMRARNAHFNLNVLGGRVGTLVPGMYGDAAPGCDTGDQTDRFIVDWELADVNSQEILLPLDLNIRIGDMRTEGQDLLIAIPSDWAQVRVGLGAVRAAQLRARTIKQCRQALDDGFMATACHRINEEVAVYIFRYFQA